MLNPYLLLFLPVAAVPIVLHLITLHRLRTVELSTFRFLMDSYIQQRRRVKLLEFILMMLRTLFVALVVLMLSRPVVDRFTWLTGGGGGAGREVAIIIDAGVSSNLRTGGTTSLERAKAAAKSIVELLDDEDQVTLIRAGERAEVMTQRFVGRREPILADIDSIEAASTASNMAAALEQAFKPGRPTQPIAYVLTDGNRRAWAGVEGHPLLSALRDDGRIILMDVGPTEPVANVGVLGDPPQVDNAVVGLPIRLAATVINNAAQAPADVVLSVILDDEQIQQIPMSLDAGEQRTEPITFVPTRAGVLRGAFRVPTDNFPDDDTYLFTLNVAPRLNVLIVSQQAGGRIEQRGEVYLETALLSPRHAAARGAEEKRIADALSVQTVTFSQLTQAMLDGSDVVLLSDVTLDPTRASWLRRYVETGGGLMIFTGPNVQPAQYAQQLLAPPNRTDAGPTIALSEAVGDPDDESRFVNITGIDLKHPILTTFNEDQAEHFNRVRLYRYFPLRIDEPEGLAAAARSKDEDAARPRALLRLADRTPVLIEQPLGRGRLLVAGFSATPLWSNVPLQPEFVPLVLRAIAHLRREAPTQAPGYVTPSRPATITMPVGWPDAKVEVTDPRGRPHAIDIHRSGDRFVGAMLETARKGYYHVRITPNMKDAPTEVDLGFAVNLDLQAADFQPLGESNLLSTLKPATVTYVRGAADDPFLEGELRGKREIWRTLIWVMFAVIAAEFLLATLRPDTRTRAARPATQPTGAIRQWATRTVQSGYRGGVVGKAIGWARRDTADKTTEGR